MMDEQQARPRAPATLAVRSSTSTAQILSIDRNLLGAALGDLTPFNTWRVVMKAGFALALGDEERKIFDAISGSRPPPARRVRELWCVIGRRGGKSRIAAALATYWACLVPHRLAAGEVGTVLVLAASRDQTRRVFDYALAFLRESPVLRQEIESTTRSEIRLRSGVVIAVHANSYRTVRGSTLLAVVMDEVAYWRDETSASPDVEVYRAVLPRWPPPAACSSASARRIARSVCCIRNSIITTARTVTCWWCKAPAPPLIRR